jgi:hypothetical protein
MPSSIQPAVCAGARRQMLHTVPHPVQAGDEGALVPSHATAAVQVKIV